MAIIEKEFSFEYTRFLSSIKKISPATHDYIEERFNSDIYDLFLRELKIKSPDNYDLIMELQDKTEKPDFDKAILRKNTAEILKIIVNDFSFNEGYSPTGVLKPVTVHLKKKIDKVDELVEDHGGVIRHTFSFNNKIFIARLTEDAIKNLRKNPNIEKIVKSSGVVKIMAQETTWPIYLINAHKAHAKNLKGTGVKLGMLDTGVDYNHPELKDRYKGGWNFIIGNNDPMDDHYHGTYTAGIACASDNDIGLLGVAPEVDLYACKVLNSMGGGYWEDVAAAIDWCVINGIDIISMSLGGSTGSDIIKEACDNAWHRGLILVAASGNTGIEGILYPAKYDSVIAVGAVDNLANRASFSTYGPELGLVAPGVNVFSTCRQGCPFCYPSSGYTMGSGTSAAAPHVAAVAALVKQWYPKGTNEDIRGLMKQYATDL